MLVPIPGGLESDPTSLAPSVPLLAGSVRGQGGQHLVFPCRCGETEAAVVTVVAGQGDCGLDNDRCGSIIVESVAEPHSPQIHHGTGIHTCTIGQ